MSTDREVLRLEGITKRFGRREVLRGIDLMVRHGEVIVLIGSSGSGKTTLLRCINLLVTPDNGTIVLDGDLLFQRSAGTRASRLLSAAEVNRIRAKTGMVFQLFHLFPHMTVLENVMEGPRTVKRRPVAEAREDALQLLQRVGLAEHVGKYPAQLSGGQQQRVAIARALAMDPTLMLFDEPTSALDPELVGEVLRVILNLARDGMTMLIVSHELGFAFEIADRVLFLDEGRIAAEGPARDLLLRPSHPRLASFVERFHETARMLKPFID